MFLISICDLAAFETWLCDLAASVTRQHSASVSNVFICCQWVLQDFAFIEQQRQLVFGKQAESSQSAADSTVAAQADAPIKGRDYQKLKAWKDAVGAPTFSQLHRRCTRFVPLSCSMLIYSQGCIASM